MFNTKTYTVTEVSLADLRSILRADMAACGIDVDDLVFNIAPNTLIRVASAFDLTSPCEDTLVDVIVDDPPKNGEVWLHQLEMYLAVLTDAGLYKEKAIPKSDYLILPF